MSETEINDLTELFSDVGTEYQVDLLERLETLTEEQAEISSKLDTVIEGQAAISTALYSILGLAILAIAIKLLWTVLSKWLFGGI